MDSYKLGLTAGRAAALFPTLKGGIDWDAAERLNGEADEDFLGGYIEGLFQITGIWPDE